VPLIFLLDVDAGTVRSLAEVNPRGPWVDPAVTQIQGVSLELSPRRETVLSGQTSTTATGQDALA